MASRCAAKARTTKAIATATGPVHQAVHAQRLLGVGAAAVDRQPLPQLEARDDAGAGVGGGLALDVPQRAGREHDAGQQHQPGARRGQPSPDRVRQPHPATRQDHDAGGRDGEHDPERHQRDERGGDAAEVLAGQPERRQRPRPRSRLRHPRAARAPAASRRIIIRAATGSSSTVSRSASTRISPPPPMRTPARKPSTRACSRVPARPAVGGGDEDQQPGGEDEQRQGLGVGGAVDVQQREAEGGGERPERPPPRADHRAGEQAEREDAQATEDGRHPQHRAGPAEPVADGVPGRRADHELRLDARAAAAVPVW